MHMPTFDNPQNLAVGHLVVSYVATGAEGMDFAVPIGRTLSGVTYAVLWAPSGVTNLPIADLPNGVGDRTTTQFRVTTAAPLTAGDKLTFVIFEE